MAKMELMPHAAANIFPQMNRADYEGLKNDVMSNGLREKIVIYQGQILDGRNRYRACTEAGIEPDFRQYEGHDPIAFVLSVNLHRRHLRPGQRAMIAAELTTSKHGGDRSKAQNCALTHAQAARQFAISERQVDKAAKVLKAETSGRVSAGLMAQIRSGELSLAKAEKLVRLPLNQQRQFIANNDRHTSARPRTPEVTTCLERQLDEVISQTERLCTRIKNLFATVEGTYEIAPEQRNRLVEAWRKAPRWLFVESESQKETASPSYGLPFVEA
jgi:hypothetical protein